MLTDQVDRYLSLRRSLGFKLRAAERHLRAYAGFAAKRGDTHVRVATAMDWAAAASSPHLRLVWMRDLVKFTHFVKAEDPLHEVPPLEHFRVTYVRPVPYIYSSDEIARIIGAAKLLPPTYPLRRQVYATLFGLIASTGLRISEALDLRFHSILPESVLRIENTKFRKSRLVALHPTTQNALDEYLHVRRRVAVESDHLFISERGRRLCSSTVNSTFRRILTSAAIAPERFRRPRIHDLRHTFATRALESCQTKSVAVSRHFVALSTYLGHVDIKSTYWYLEATAKLMADMAAAAETLAGGGDQ